MYANGKILLSLLLSVILLTSIIALQPFAFGDDEKILKPDKTVSFLKNTDLEGNVDKLIDYGHRDIGQQLDSTIRLDKEFYSWTDEIEIFVTAPSFNRHSGVEQIGAGNLNQGLIQIETSVRKIPKYVLVETDGDSGIFFGKIRLTGMLNMGISIDGKHVSPSGQTSGLGPVNGFLAVTNNDKIKVIFSNSYETIETSSKVGWVLGEIIWNDDFLIPGKSVEIRVKDPDMNLNNYSEDMISVIVWSDIDKRMISVDLREQGINSGVFNSFITLSTALTTGTKIRVTDNINFYVQYLDMTVPYSFTGKKTSEILSIMPVSFEPIKKDSTPPSELEFTSDENDEDLIGTASNELFGTIHIENTVFSTSAGKQTMIKISGEVKEYNKNYVAYVTIIGPDDFIYEDRVRVGNTKQFSSYFPLDFKSPQGNYIIIAQYGDFSSDSLKFKVVNPVKQVIKELFVIPDWIKNTARWWSSGQIGDSDFTEGLQYLIKEGTIKVRQDIQISGKSDTIPSWVKNNAKWWADGLIGNNDFVAGLEYLIEQGIIKV